MNFIAAWFCAYALPLAMDGLGSAPIPLESARHPLLREAGPKWRQFLEESRRLEGTSEVIHLDSALGGGSRVETTLKKNKRCFYYMTQRYRKNPDGSEFVQEGRLEGENPKYSFSLARQSKEAPWLKTNHQIKKPEPDAALVHEPHSFLLVVFRGRTIDQLAESPSFQVEDVQKVDDAAGPLLAVTFRWKDPKSADALLQGKVLLDQKAFWVVRSAQVDLIINGTPVGHEEIRHSYETNNGFPIATGRAVQSEVTTSKGVKERGTSSTKLEYHFTRNQHPDSDFTLSAFGLPEPHGVDWPRPTPWWLYAPIAGVTLILAGVLVRRFAGRRAAAWASRSSSCWRSSAPRRRGAEVRIFPKSMSGSARDIRLECRDGEAPA